MQSSEGNIIPVTAANMFRLTEENTLGESNLIQFYFVKFETNLSDHS